MVRFFKMLVLLGAALLISFQLSETAIAEPTAAPEKIVISQFGKEKFLLYLPLYIAMEEGLFAKRGLEIDLRFVGNDDQIFATVISGDALFGVGDPVFAAISREKGGPGRIVAMMITKLGLSGYTNQERVGVVDGAEDLKGLRISSFPAPSTTFTLLKEFILSNKLDQTGTEIVQAAMGAQLAALEAGNVDIAVDLEPTVSIAEAKGYRVVFNLDMFTDAQAITGISTLESTIETRPELVKKVVSALQEALTLLHSNPEVSLRVAKRLFPNLSDSVVKAAVNRMLKLGVYPSSVVVDDKLWQRTLKTRIDSKELRRPQPTEFTVDNRFAEQAALEQTTK